MPKRTCLALILAAGEGTRMRSAVPKAMHKVGGLPMVGYVLAAAAAAGATERAVVIGPDADAMGAFLADIAPDASIHVQAERRGTAHAVLAARRAFAKPADDIVVLYADTPMVTAKTIRRLRRSLANGADLVVLGCRPADPTGYGRLIVENRRLIAIREEKDASSAERSVDLCNSGIMAFSGSALAPILKRIGSDNAKGEFYLTDAVAIANRGGRKVAVLEADADEVAGVNSRHQLAQVEGIFQRRARQAAMENGATLIAPHTAWFSHDTRLGRDVTVEPNVWFGPGVTVADGVTIRANCHIEGARIAAGAIVGPFARIRPNTVIGPKVRVGDFVEVKNATLDEGVKANHLAYVGDAHVGAHTNIGAGAIVANYDGFAKHHTEIGAGVSIGSNAVLVSPVAVGDGAFVAAGSVITQDVGADALAVARARQEEKPDWARHYRELKGPDGNRIATKVR